jgi:trigger factor
MQISKKDLSPTKVELVVTADESFLTTTKQRVLQSIAKDVKLAGFRKGHAPEAMVEKAIDQAQLQKDFIDSAVNSMFMYAIQQQNLRPVAQPEVELNAFVPFTTMSIKITADVVGEVTLPDYKKFSAKKEIKKVTADDVAAVITDLQSRSAQKNAVDRPAKNGDEIIIDFTGSDVKTKKPIDDAQGTDYPITIGSDTFIPGFEPELVGLKAGDKKTFSVTFPKDYGAKALQNKKVTFAVTAKEVKEVVLPKVDDAFAATIGPFKSVNDLKADIKKQLITENDAQAQRLLENKLLVELAQKTTVAIPPSLIDDEVERMIAEEKQNLLYRGQTWAEFLQANGTTEEQYRTDIRVNAEQRVKTGLSLGQMSQNEGISVTEAEVDRQISALKQQYTDAKMQAELDKPENRRDIHSRIVTERAIARLVEYAVKQP